MIMMDELKKSCPDLYFTVPATPDEIASAAAAAGEGRFPIIQAGPGFVQKAYDQIVHDICRNGLHAVFAVAQDGTFCSFLDFSCLAVIPDMTLLAPKNRRELADMLRWAAKGEGPVAVFYPDGGLCCGFDDFCMPVERGKSEIMYDEGDIALIAAGSMVETAAAVRNRLKEFGYGCSLINARFIRPLDEKMLVRTAASHSLIVTLEENIRCGGFGDRVLEYLNDIGNTARVISIALPDDYSGCREEGLEKENAMLNENSILMRILAEYTGRRDLS